VGRIRRANPFLNLVYRDDGPLVKSLEHAQAVAGGTSEVRRDRIATGFAQGQDAPGRLGCLRANLGHTAQEKREPILPGAAVAMVLGERDIGVEIIREMRDSR
jgi:hypothetical protein